MNENSIVGMFAAVDSRNWSNLPMYFAGEVVYERPGYDPIRGINDLVDFYANRRIIASGRHELDSVVINADAGAVWGRFLGKSRSGDSLDVRFADTYVFSNGVILRRVSFFFTPLV